MNYSGDIYYVPDMAKSGRTDQELSRLTTEGTLRSSE